VQQRGTPTFPPYRAAICLFDVVVCRCVMGHGMYRNVPLSRLIVAEEIKVCMRPPADGEAASDNASIVAVPVPAAVVRNLIDGDEEAGAEPFVLASALWPCLLGQLAAAASAASGAASTAVSGDAATTSSARVAVGWVPKAASAGSAAFEGSVFVRGSTVDGLAAGAAAPASDAGAAAPAAATRPTVTTPLTLHSHVAKLLAAGVAGKTVLDFFLASDAPSAAAARYAYSTGGGAEWTERQFSLSADACAAALATDDTATASSAEDVIRVCMAPHAEYSFTELTLTAAPSSSSCAACCAPASGGPLAVQPSKCCKRCLLDPTMRARLGTIMFDESRNIAIAVLGGWALLSSSGVLGKYHYFAPGGWVAL